MHFGESLMQSLTEKVIQVPSWMFFYLKCKQDKICSFNSSVFLKDKTAHPNPVRDSAKERKVLSVTEDSVWFLFQNMVRLLLNLRAGESYPGHPPSSELHLVCCVMSCSSQSRDQLVAPPNHGKLRRAKLWAGALGGSEFAPLAPVHRGSLCVCVQPFFP